MAPKRAEAFDHPMTTAAADDGPTATGEDRARAKRRLTRRVPMWVRVTAITAAVLLGVLLSTMFLGASGVADRDRSGGHGSGGQTEMNGDKGSDHTGGDHGPGGDHTGGDHGPGREHG